MVELLDSRIPARRALPRMIIDTSMDLLSQVDRVAAEEINSLLSQIVKESAS